MGRDRSASPKRTYGKKDWFKHGLSKNTLVYFHIVLECDSPILEALFCGLPGRYAEWTGVDPSGMSRYLFEKICDCFAKSFVCSESWSKHRFANTKYPDIIQWRKPDQVIEIFLIRHRHQAPMNRVCHLVRMALYEGPSDRAFASTAVSLLYENELAMNPQPISPPNGTNTHDWTIPMPSEIELEISLMVHQFYTKHKTFFESA
jgi:hypothetical protein